MKKVLIVLISCLLILGVAYAVANTDIVQKVISKVVPETEITEQVAENTYYYNLLDLTQQKIYSSMYNSLHRLEDSTVIIFGKEKEVSKDDVNTAFQALILDNYDLFYIDSGYSLTEKNIFGTHVVKIKYDYMVPKDSILQTKQDMEEEVENIISKNITEEMTTYEKELSIYSYLVKSINYYEYSDIDSIPFSKHTIYGALIEKTAVCDGITKAFSYILNKLNIENIVVLGSLNDVSHSWSQVKIDNKWYNVDVTLGRQNVAGSDLFHVTHLYFNAPDSDMKTSHTKSTQFILPECSDTEYNYYIKEGMYLWSGSEIKAKINKTMVDNKSKDILELKAADDIKSTDIINALYDLNFNNYRTRKITEIKYSIQNNVYVFTKK